MWNYLYELWRSVLRPRPRPRPREETPAPPVDDPARSALRDELRRLLEERTTLQKTAASYREFGYDDLAGRMQEEIGAVDRKIGELRLQLRRRAAAPR